MASRGPDLIAVVLEFKVQVGPQKDVVDVRKHALLQLAHEPADWEVAS